jgi:beta-mannosidase
MGDQFRLGRREFVKGMTAIPGAALGSHDYQPSAIDTRAANSSSRRSTQILSEGWSVRQLDDGPPDIAQLTMEATSPGNQWLKCRMPAQIHDILLAHGLISDPRIGRNAETSAWVGQKDWVYACTFTSPLTSGGPVFLRFRGLDTLATAYLNSAEIGRCTNMNRSYTIDVSRHLARQDKKNVLLIVFSSPLRFIDEVQQPAEHVGIIAKHKYLRKSLSDFATPYFGIHPHSVKVGIFRDVVLDVPSDSWIQDVWVRSELSPDHRQAKLRAVVQVGGAAAQVGWTLSDPAGQELARGRKDAATPVTEFEIDVQDPKLWWPRTHGKPDLYELRVDIGNPGQLMDTYKMPVGIREVRLILKDRATGEKRFQFEVSGQPIYLQGANWTPVEGMTHCWHREQALGLLDLLEQVGMNILRVWGDAYMPPEEFYDECDRRGFLVWQDFMFGHGMHPNGNPEFDDNCRGEIEQIIRTLRNHPSLLLWCGGNENYQGLELLGVKSDVGRSLFERIMPDACAALDPSRPFHPSSPYGGPYSNWPLEGDWHDYAPVSFYPESSVPLFASELGAFSAPRLTSLRKFLSDEELWPKGFDPAVRNPRRPAWPPMWAYRTWDAAWDWIAPVERFCDPASADDLVRVLGTAHGEYLQERVERYRRGVPDGSPAGKRRNWGNMLSGLYDPWPTVHCGVIDYYLEPKIAYYFLRRAYAPVLVCFERTPDRIHVWVVNDSMKPVSGTLTVRRLLFDGSRRGELSTGVEVAPGESKRCLDLTDFGPISLRNEFLWATCAGREATYLLIGERHLGLPEANLCARRVDGGIEITTDRFARQISLDGTGAAGALFDDNFFDLAPGGSRTVSLVGSGREREIVIGALNAKPITLVL